MTQPTLIVTGDIVLDCHLYGGVKTAATSFREPGTQYRQELGGAVLTRDLIRAAADVKGLAWDALVEKWKAENRKREEAGKAPLPWPEDLAPDRPTMTYGAHLALDTSGLETSLPPHLRSYGVWTGQAVSKDNTRDRVWRAVDAFGYGSTEPARQSGVFTPNPVNPGGEVVLTLIDDGALVFRQGGTANVWPRLDASAGGWHLLKMSWPLCRGDLWAALNQVMDRLIVVVSAADLRREDVQINPRLSWEQCAEHTIDALRADPVAGDLLRAAHVIVNYESEGALWFERTSGTGKPAWRLLFDHELLEGDHASRIEGHTYGRQTCIAVGVAHGLMAAHACAAAGPGPFGDAGAMRKAIEAGVTAGIATRRMLLESGHGPVGGSQKPGVPVQALGARTADVAAKPVGLELVEIPETVVSLSACEWTILQQSEHTDDPLAQTPTPLTGLGQLTALHGPTALAHVPALRMGALFTVDRTEIESIRTLEALIRRYDEGKVQPKPLSIGVFGPPGAGKSFGVKALAKAVLGDKVPFLEFNLSQFKGPDELVGAFHRVRDVVLGGITPIVFWDEFDSQQYKWLQYLLAPMQDGSFQEGQVTHPIGKCVFIFAGGTAPAIEEFGVAAPDQFDEGALAELGPDERTERRRLGREQAERYREFVLLKGPDFISRLHGFLNVLGPNPRSGCACPDITWPIRRALILRGILRLKAGDLLDIDAGLLNALLAVPMYRHGARSFEKIITALVQGRECGRFNRSGLPPAPLLDRETDAGAFESLMRVADAFKNHPDLEALAAAIHARFLDAAAKSKLEAAMEANPAKAWTIHPAIMMAYDALDSDSKASNRAAARRIPDHLALIGFVVERQQQGETDGWQAPIEAAIKKHVDRLAQAEHLGWWAERKANGWSFAKDRNDALKHHPLMVDWSKLSQTDKDKDRSSAISIPELLEVAKFKAVPVRVGP